MRRTGWPRATSRRSTLASGSTKSPCRRLPAAARLTASHGRRSGRWRAASSRDALLFQLLGSVPGAVVPILDGQQQGVVRRIPPADLRFDDPVVPLPLDDSCPDRHGEVHDDFATLAPGVVGARADLLAPDRAVD